MSIDPWKAGLDRLEQQHFRTRGPRGPKGVQGVPSPFYHVEDRWATGLVRLALISEGIAPFQPYRQPFNIRDVNDFEDGLIGELTHTPLGEIKMEYLLDIDFKMAQGWMRGRKLSEAQRQRFQQLIDWRNKQL